MCEEIIPAYAIISAMSTLTFDTLGFTERLKAAGVPPGHAVAGAEALRDAFSEALDNSVATKRDISTLNAKVDDVQSSVDRLEARLEARIDTGFAAVDARFEKMDARMDARFAGIDARFEKMDARMDARFAAIDARFEKTEVRIDTGFAAVDAMFDKMTAVFDGKLNRQTAVFEGKFDKLTWMLGAVLAVATGIFVKQLL